MNRKDIENCALRNGFSHKELGGGAYGLRPYVYSFAEDLLKTAREGETLTGDIETFLTPIIEQLDLMIDRSSKPAALCAARGKAEQAVRGDRLEGKISFLLIFLGDLEFLVRRNGDYSQPELSHIISQVRTFIIKMAV